MLIIALGASLILVLLSPQVALAWGPLTHLTHGATVLDGLTTLSAALQELLGANRMAYLYGCVGADIVQAKRYASSLRTHCHSWHVGWKMLAEAGTDIERAFAYGYLSHLAADVFSHNHFVPLQLIASYRSRTLLHTYWEARFDALQPRKNRALLAQVLRRLYPQCDRLMERVVERTLFSFRTNKRIFNSVMALQRLEQWQALMQRVAARSRYPLEEATVERYNQICAQAIASLLTKGRRAHCVKSDPTGAQNISRAHEIRRKLKRLERRGRLDQATRANLIEKYLPELSRGGPGAELERWQIPQTT